MKRDTTEPSECRLGASGPWPEFDSRDLRRALGTFATGVTVVTSLDPEGGAVGFTANSFTSVSLDPPLILVCLAKAARSRPAFSQAGRFAVNVLSEGQREVANRFATAGADKFAEVSSRAEASGAPVLAGASAWFDCVTHDEVDAGDHVILIGRVLAYAQTARPPLGYCRGTYIKLETTAALDAALDTAEDAEPLRVGAIVERGGKVLFQRDARTGRLRLPTARRMGRPGDEEGLLARLRRAGLEVRPSFLYSVFESGPAQEVYYRAAAPDGPAPTDPTFAFRALEDATLDRIDDPAVRSMLRRYRGERDRDFFGIYVGTHEAGDVRPLGNGDSL